MLKSHSSFVDLFIRWKVKEGSSLNSIWVIDTERLCLSRRYTSNDIDVIEFEKGKCIKKKEKKNEKNTIVQASFLRKKIALGLPLVVYEQNGCLVNEIA